MKIPFNFGKEIKKMSEDEDVKNNREEQSSNSDGYSNFIKDINKSTIEFHSKDQDQEYSYSHYGYEYKTIVPTESKSGNIRKYPWSTS